MTEQQKQHAAEVLVKNSMMLLGSTEDDPKYLPKVFVVNGKCYWFLARFQLRFLNCSKLVC